MYNINKLFTEIGRAKEGIGIERQMLDVLSEIELTVGTGENRFTMRRGSFRCRQRFGKKLALCPAGREETENGLRLRYEHAAGAWAALRLREEDGRVILSLELPADAPWNRFWLTLPADPAEHIYGCGEVYSTLDLKGERVRIWVAEHQNAQRIGKKLLREKLFGKRPARTLPFGRYESYYAQPTFVSSEKYYVHADGSAYCEFDFRRPDRTTLYFQEPPTLYCERCGSFAEISRRLTALAGRQPPLPDWAYDGAVLAIQGGTEAVERKLAAALDAGAAICGVWSQDWCGCRRTGFGYQVMWNWEWDRELYPDLDRRIGEWKARGVRFLGYINPFLALEGNLYKTAAARGYCVKDRAGKDYLVTITTFPAAMIDLTNPAAWQWYKEIVQTNMIDLGLSGWMADFGEYLPVDAVLHSGEDPALVHNRWPVLWARLNREAVEERGVSDEVFFFTRAGFTGTAAQSPMMWTGDQHVDWSADDGLPAVIPAALSLAMSGCAAAHADVGGYTTVMHMRRSKELLLRWEELGAFSPLMRFHEGNQPGNNVQFDGDGELLAQLVRTSRWHAALKPYLTALAAEVAERGVPMMRPLFYHYDEPAAYGEKTEYLLGRDILVAPVLREGAVRRAVYLPEDAWVHWATGEEYGGGTFTVEAPIGCPPVFLRKNSERLRPLRNIKRGEQPHEEG